MVEVHKVRKPNDLIDGAPMFLILAQEQLTVFVSRVSPAMQNDPVSHDHLHGPPASINLYPARVRQSVNAARMVHLFHREFLQSPSSSPWGSESYGLALNSKEILSRNRRDSSA